MVFRTGLLDSMGGISFDPVSPFVEPARKVKDRLYHRHTFTLKLTEMGAYNAVAEAVLSRLGARFVFDDLVRAINETDRSGFDSGLFFQTAKDIRWLARSNYHLTFPANREVSEVVIFPVTENESRGIEDARFVPLHR